MLLNLNQIVQSKSCEKPLPGHKHQFDTNFIHSSTKLQSTKRGKEALASAVLVQVGQIEYSGAPNPIVHECAHTLEINH